MKLGVLTTSYPRAPGDSAGSFVAAHVTALRRLGHHVDVIAARPQGADSSSLAGHGSRAGAKPPDDRVTWIGSRLFDRGGAPDHLENHAVRALASAAWFSARLTAVVARRSRGWDSIVAHWLVPSALAALPARIPLLAIAHGGDIHTLHRLRLLAPTLHALHARRAMLAFVSEPLRAIARAAAPRLSAWLDAATIQPMGLDLARFAAIDHAPTQPPTLLVVARLVDIKGVDVAIEAVARVRAPVRLVIAGDGPQRAVLEARGRAVLTKLREAKPGASSGDPAAYAIELVGAVDPDHRDRLLRTASAVIVPSRITRSGRTEGMPMIAHEAMAAGVPVVASNVGGLAGLAELARLVPPDDPAALAAAIDLVLSSPPDAELLRATVAHLDWATVAPRLVRKP